MPGIRDAWALQIAAGSKLAFDGCCYRGSGRKASGQGLREPTFKKSSTWVRLMLERRSSSAPKALDDVFPRHPSQHHEHRRHHSHPSSSIVLVCDFKYLCTQPLVWSLLESSDYGVHTASNLSLCFLSAHYHQLTSEQVADKISENNTVG